LAGPIKFPVSQTIYESKYGPTFKTEQGVFAWSFVVGESIKMAEQWYKMNKATNFAEFKSAVEMRGIAALNFVYADREDNIYYLSNGSFPNRNPKYDWSGILPGNTSETLWGKELIPFDSLPQVLNPKGGWVFNTNNTPYNATDSLSNFKETSLNKVMGFQSKGLENNRSNRFLELISEYDSLSYADFKRIKYDNQYPSKMMTPKAINLENLMHLDASKYPDISDAISQLTNWNRKSDLENTTAALFIISWLEIDRIRTEAGRNVRYGTITEEDCVTGIRKAQKELLKKYGSLKIPLKKVQRLIRGDVNLPMAGMPDVLAAMYSKEHTDGTYKAFAGESYIELVRFGEKGVEIESVNTFGTSEKLNSKYYTTEMKLFATQQLKKMTLNKDEILKNAVKIYAPKGIKK
jgi:acyl-homoserine-lactone acylase